ncbi:putative chromatin organization chromo domain containing protein [Diaporthe ampelina]|uniref:Putative chromatin organization chromo domain containing protein n=1 Tax=Diaporthe ampelina TaxID=1214573 RepID=A0A0G2FMP5_9PEZI|nr:putative chromatin organization chromo domain containing protein [Diaporthe ampelina]
MILSRQRRRKGEQDYVVKRLEGDYILDGVHWFRVRWEGDWPDDENPTWEPRENIAEKLVKQYLKTKAKRSADRPLKSNSNKKPKTKQTNLLADWAKGYGSVTEAFEGQAELNATSEAMLDPGGGQDRHTDADDGPDELLVIDDQESQTAAEARKKAMEAQIAAQFASMARAAPRHF